MPVCLLMIVKNSGEVLRKTLQSFLPYVDHYCICDTGSTDHTLDIIVEECAGYSGYLFEEGFRDFSYNRNRVVEEAEQRFPGCYYVMIDDSYLLVNGEQFKEFLSTAEYPLFCVQVQSPENAYPLISIYKGGFRYRYRIHEYIYTKKKAILIPNFFYIDDKPDEHEQRTKERTQFDLDNLLADLKDYPNDPRLMFYLARTYYIAGRLDEAGEWFKKRVNVKGKCCPDETFYSMMYISSIGEQKKESREKMIELYEGIFRMFPHHPEPLYYASQCYDQLGKKDKAIEVLEKAYQTYHTKKNPMFSYRKTVCEQDIPKKLCCYYFKTDAQKCVLFLFTHYASKKLPFDFQFESYLRFIHNIRPTHLYEKKWVVYTGKVNEEVNKQFIQVLGNSVSIYEEQELAEYQRITTSYEIENVLVVDRVDRLPFFPNVKKIDLMIQTDHPDFTLLITFPNMRFFIARDEAHAEHLTKEYLNESSVKRLITLDQYINLQSA